VTGSEPLALAVGLGVPASGSPGSPGSPGLVDGGTSGLLLIAGADSLGAAAVVAPADGVEFGAVVAPGPTAVADGTSLLEVKLGAAVLAGALTATLETALTFDDAPNAGPLLAPGLTSLLGSASEHAAINTKASQQEPRENSPELGRGRDRESRDSRAEAAGDCIRAPYGRDNRVTASMAPG
jgi:hypothetical protein